MSLLDRFLEHLLDIPITPTIRQQFVQGDTLALDALVSHPFTQSHILFCRVWNFLFQTYPTREDFHHFLQRMQASFERPLACNKQVAEHMLQGWKIVALGCAPSIGSWNTFVDQCCMRVHQPNYVVETLYAKWAHRFMQPYPKGGNLVEGFVKLWRDVQARSEDYEEWFACNPQRDLLTEQWVELPPWAVPNLLWTEKAQYLLMQNMHFCMRLVSTPIVTISDMIDEGDPGVMKALRHIMKHAQKRVVVFCNGEIPVPGVLHYPYPEELFTLVPRIAKWHMHVCVSDDPSIPGLAANPTHNVYWSRCPDPEIPEHPQNYDRILIDAPTQHTSAITMYQWFDHDMFWKLHTTMSCPHRTKHPSHNALLFYDALFRFHESKQRDIQKVWKVTKDPTQPCKHALLLFDNRANEMSVMACLLAMIHVPLDTWDVYVFTTQANQSFYRDKLPSYVHVEIHPVLEALAFDIDVYNDALQYTPLWEQLHTKGVEKVLILQDDGLLLKPGVEAFLSYDYVGAPWVDMPDNAYIKQHINPHLVGNGGFSLRTVEWMLRICRENAADRHTLFYHNLNRIPEDVFFVKHLVRGGARLPTAAQAAAFSSEQVLDPRSLGIHKAWVYHPVEVLVPFLQTFFAPSENVPSK